MWMVEPSGLTYNYFGCAIGKGKQPAKVEIEKLKLGDMTCRDVLKDVARIIYSVRVSPLLIGRLVIVIFPRDPFGLGSAFSRIC